MELWPNISWIYRISTSALRRQVANVCRNMWGVICMLIFASLVYLFNILLTAWADRWVLLLLTKKKSQAWILFENSDLYLVSAFKVALFPICNTRSLEPLPYIFIIPFCKSTSLSCSEHNSEIRIPVANSNSQTAASLMELCFLLKVFPLICWL